jgi:hypothetical protein
MYNHRVEDNEFKIDIDFTVEQDLKTFKEEVMDYVYILHKTHGIRNLLFSGGNDSTFLLQVLLELGITPDLLTLSFDPTFNNKVCSRAKEVCKSLSLKEPEFFFTDYKKIYEHASYIINEKNIAYPMVHAFNIDYVLNVYKDIKFLSGMGSEFKFDGAQVRLPPGPWLVKQNNPGRLYDFTSSRTFLSYINHELFVANYTKPVKRINGGLFGPKDEWYIRDLIYNDCYKKLNLPSKTTNDGGRELKKLDEDIAVLFHDKIPDMMWGKIKPFYFDVIKYFNNKNL